MNKNLELMVAGRPDRGLNHTLIMDAFNQKPLGERVFFINEMCDILNLDDSTKIEDKLFNISEILLTFLEIPYDKKSGKIQVVALSRNDLINQHDTYLLNLSPDSLIEVFASSKNKLLVEDDQLGDKLFDAIYKTESKKSNQFKI